MKATGEKLTLNLASRVPINRRALYVMYTVVTGVLTLIMIFNLFQLKGMQAQSRKLRTYLAEAGVATTVLQRPETVTKAQIQRQHKEIADVNDLLMGNAFRWTALLGRLEEAAIEGVSLRSIQPDYREGALRITGLVRRMEILEKYLDGLIAAPHFSDVFLLQQSTVTVRHEHGGERQAINFSLVLKGAF
jgi:hypothetical protein